MASKDACLLVGAVCITFVPFVLQSVGFFTPMWGSSSTCNSIGLIYSCCAGTDNMTCEITKGLNVFKDWNAKALGAEATSFSVMFLAVLFTCCGVCCYGLDNDPGWCGVLGVLFILLLPLAGLCSVIGCIIVATKFSTSELGYSFALCLTAGVLVIILTIIGVCLICMFVKDDDKDDKSTRQPSRIGRSAVSPSPQPTDVQPYHGGGAAVSPSPQPTDVQPNHGDGEAAPQEPRTQQVEYEIRRATHHQAVAFHDHKTGGIFVFMNKFNIISRVTRVKSKV